MNKKQLEKELELWKEFAHVLVYNHKIFEKRINKNANFLGYIHDTTISAEIVGYSLSCMKYIDEMNDKLKVIRKG